MRLALLLILLAVGCDPHLPHQDQFEQAATQSVFDAWESMGFRPPRPAFEFDAFQMTFPVTEAGFLRLCPKSAGCFRWKNITPCGLCETSSYPIAVVNPMAKQADLPIIAVHELAHGFVYSTGRHPSLRDPYDAFHTDLKVWGDRKGLGTADSVVRRALEAFEASEAFVRPEADFSGQTLGHGQLLPD